MTSRDLAQTLAAMTRQNQERDAAIDHVNRTLAEMTAQNANRDAAIHILSTRTASMTEQGANGEVAEGQEIAPRASVLKGNAVFL